MNVLNRDDIQRALDRIVGKTSWNVDAIIDGAERFAMENGYTDRDFTHEDGDAEYCFECVKPATYVYDEDGELDYGNDDSEYWLWLIRDKKTGRDICRKHSPQYEEKFKGTKASANKAQGVKADEKKEVFVYKAMDVNGNGVFKVFYDDGTYEILKGGKATERNFNDYDKRVSMETLRHATAPPKGKARRAGARKVRAAISKEKAVEIAENLYWGVRDYGDVVEFELSSPAGEDFVFSVDADNVADNVWEYAQNFDVEEHVQEVMGMDGAPGLRELLEDAEEIRGMLEELATALLRADGDTDKEGVEGSARRRSKKNVSADLKIICELGDYQPWQGAVETYNRIKDAGMLDDFERLMEEAYPEGLTMTGLNDILWFEPEWVFEMLGMDNGDEDDEYDEYED